MSPGKRKQIDSTEKAIETALSPGQFISYNAAWSFVDDVQDVADDIGKIIRKEPKRAARLYEIFIAACHEKADEIDDSSGNFGMLVEELFRGWIKARQGAKNDPDETAISLISWMEDDPYRFCHDLDRGVVKVLDKKGLEAFIQQIRSKFESSPTQGDEEKLFSGYARRRWGGALKTLLAAQRNVDACIALCDQTELEAKDCYIKTGLDADWQAVVADVRKRHFRKKGFMAGFEDIVTGAPRYVEPPFLERAKARWPRKSDRSWTIFLKNRFGKPILHAVKVDNQNGQN